MFKGLRREKFKSPNFGERAGGRTPCAVILHYTGMKDAKSALARLCDPAAQVSAHYVVEENGRIHHLVDDDKRAWHAGVSCWQGERDMNSAAIGIEIVNPGHECGYSAFPAAQVSAVTKLIKELMDRYSIPAAHILGHSDIAPARKQDPGELFPWQALAAQGIGLWPQPQEMDYQAAQDLLSRPDDIRGLFSAYGYDPDVGFETIVKAFHRHFYPEKFNHGHDPSSLDTASVARLLSLIRQRHERESL